MLYYTVKADLKIDAVKSRLDSKGRIKMSDFIEFSIEAKLLDLTDGHTRKKAAQKSEPSNGKEKSREESTKKQVSDDVEIL